MTTKTEETKGAFDDLLADLGAMVKALPADGADADDDKIAAAAGDAGDGDADDKGGAADGDADDTVVKSFKFKLEDGTEVDAVDGTEMIKSLVARVEKTEADMALVISQAVSIIKSQGEMIKSLQGKVETFAKGGVGRKAVLSIAERPAAAAAAVAAAATPDGISPDDFMAKALSAQVAGKITGADIARAEAHLNRGMAPPKDIVQAVLGE